MPRRVSRILDLDRAMVKDLQGATLGTFKAEIVSYCLHFDCAVLVLVNLFRFLLVADIVQTEIELLRELCIIAINL